MIKILDTHFLNFYSHVWNKNAEGETASCVDIAEWMNEELNGKARAYYDFTDEEIYIEFDDDRQFELFALTWS